MFEFKLETPAARVAAEKFRTAEKEEKAADDRKKLWHETVRSLIIPILSALAVLWSTLYIQADRNRTEARRAIIESFMASSRKYTAETYDVIDNKGRGDRIKWEGELVDAYWADMERLRLYFGATVEGDLAAARAAAGFIADYRAGQPTPDLKGSTERLYKANQKVASTALKTLGLDSD